MEGSANMFIGLEPVIYTFFSYVELRGLWPCVRPQHSEEYFSPDSGKLKPEIIRKNYPRLFQAFIKAGERTEK